MNHETRFKRLEDAAQARRDRAEKIGPDREYTDEELDAWKREMDAAVEADPRRHRLMRLPADVLVRLYRSCIASGLGEADGLIEETLNAHGL
jgi:hypothetical protein